MANVLRPLWHLSKLGSHSPTETRRPWLCLLVGHIPRMAPRFLGQTFLGCRRYTSKAQRTLNRKISKVNALRRVRSGTDSQVLVGTNSKFFWKH